MSLQWQFISILLYFEIAVIFFLLLPFISPVTWRQLFKSRVSVSFKATSKYYFNFMVAIYALLLFDAIREIRSYSNTSGTDISKPYSDDHRQKKLFLAQRNFYITGFALFLWFVIKRLISLIASCARTMDECNATRYEANDANLHLNELKLKQTDTSRSLGLTEAQTQLENYKKELIQAREDISTLNARCEYSDAQYKKLQEAHRQLQDQLNMSLGGESSKDK